MKKSAVAVGAVVTAVALVLAGCTQRSNQTAPQAGAAAAGFPETAPNPVVPGRPGGVFRLGITEPTAIDSFNVQESEGGSVADMLFTGLLEVQPDGSPVAGVAQDWSSNDDCTVWTFNLKPGTTFHNGEPVNAASFKRGWERAAAPNSGSEVGYHMDVIQGYSAFQGGSASELAGVNATDPNRVVVTLDRPECEFDLRTIHPVFSPVPTAVGTTTDTAYTDAPIGNGPFRMDGAWRHDQGVRLVRFDGYTAGPRANLDAVEWTILPAANAQQLEYDGFRAGQFDWARIPPTLLTQARSELEPQGKWLSKRTNAMNYFVTVTTTTPLNSVEARKAVSMAIDRAAISAGIFQNAQPPATSLVPAAFPAAYQEGVCTACTFNLDEARRLAQQAGLTPGTELNLSYNTGGGHEEWTAAVRQQLEQNLGLRVNYSGVPFVDHLNNMEAPTASGLYRLAWSADYPTPGNYLNSLLSTRSIALDAQGKVTGNNYSRYSNPEVDAILDRATATKDPAARTELWKQAEQIAIGRDLGLMPLFARQQSRALATDRFNNINMDFEEDPTFDQISVK